MNQAPSTENDTNDTANLRKNNNKPAQWTTNDTAGILTAATGNSCLDDQIERLKRCEYLREGEVKALCLRAREILVDESNVQRVDAPVTVSSFRWIPRTMTRLVEKFTVGCCSCSSFSLYYF